MHASHTRTRARRYARSRMTCQHEPRTASVFLSLLVAVRAATRRTPCWGDSPRGTRWVYAMPEHTGTATVHPFLYTHAPELGIELNASSAANGCQHSHEALHPPRTNLTFAFVANPFRRVLSNAAHNSVISVGKKSTNRTTEEEIEAFRKWVNHTFCVKVHHNIPHCIWQQASVLRLFPKPLLLHATNNLTRGFAETLRVLGYPPDLFTGFSTVHCSATCTEPLAGSVDGVVGSHVHDLHAGQTFEGMARASNKASVAWYDDATARRVRDLFQVDFGVFGFSPDPAHMWDARGDAQPERLGSLTSAEVSAWRTR